MNEHHETLPEKLEEVERQRYHAQCLIRCLEAKLDRIEPFSSEFNETMAALDQAHAAVHEAGTQAINLRQGLPTNCPGQE